MDVQALKAERREATGTAEARRLRRKGKVPCVLYGHGEEVVSLAVPADGVHQLLESGQHLVSLEVDGKPERALVKDVQFDTWGREARHLDFTRVALDETVTVAVEIVSHGTPKEVLSGGVLEQPLHSLEVECKADAIPDGITVEVGDLDAGDMVHVRDLELPAGVRALADGDTVVFIVEEARAEEEPAPEEAPEAETAEPEVIGRVAKEESEEPEDKKQEKGS